MSPGPGTIAGTYPPGNQGCDRGTRSRGLLAPCTPRQRRSSSGLPYATKVIDQSCVIAQEAFGTKKRFSRAQSKRENAGKEKASFLFPGVFSRFSGCIASGWRRSPPCPWVTRFSQASPARCVKMCVVCPEDGSRDDRPWRGEGAAPLIVPRAPLPPFPECPRIAAAVLPLSSWDPAAK